MAKKLVIQVEAKDQVSAPIRKMVTGVLSFGKSVVRVDKTVVGSVERMTKRLFTLRKALLGLAVVVVFRRMVQSFNQATIELDRLAKTARQFEIPVEQYSALEFAAERSGIEVAVLGTALRTLQTRMGQVARGEGGQAVRAFRRIEQAGANLNTRGVPLMVEVADALANITDQSEKMATAAAILGEDAAAKFLRFGRDLGPLIDEAERFGTITSLQTAAAESVRDAVSNMSRAWLFFRANVIATVGPAVADLVNSLALATKKAGELVGEILKVVVTAMGDGPVGEQARAALQSMFKGLFADSLRVIKAMVTGLVTVGATLALELLEPVAVAITKGLGRELEKKWRENVVPLWTGMLAEMGLISDKELGERGLENIRKLSRIGSGHFDAMMSDIAEVLEHGSKRMQTVSDQAGASIATAVDGVGESLAAAREQMRELIKLIGDADRKGKDAAASTKMTLIDLIAKAGEFGRGMADSLTRFKQEAEDAFLFGQQFATALTGSLTDGVSSAIWDAIEGVKSLKDAFKDFARTTLRLLGEMITRALIARAIGAIVGGVAVSGSATAHSGQLLPSGGPGAFAAHGGLVDRNGIHRFAGGGMVPGPDVKRDIVPAVLMPREFVMNRRAVDRIGPSAMQYMNRHGRLPEQAPPVVVNITMNVQGSVDNRSVPRLAESIGDMLDQQLARRPALRDRLRSHLS